MMYAKVSCERRAGRARRGTTAVELAFILPIVALLILGTIDFAQVMYAYGTVSEAARAGARYAVVHGSMAASPVGPTANDATVQSVVRSYALALDTSQVTVTSTWPRTSNNASCPVTVTATYKCPLSVAKIIGLGSVNVSGSTTMLIMH